MALKQGDIDNFEMLKKAFRNDDVALIESKDAKTGEYLALICAVVRDSDGSYVITPFGHLNKGDPYEDYTAPITALDEDERGES